MFPCEMLIGVVQIVTICPFTFSVPFFEVVL